MVDVMFTTARDVESAVETETLEEDEEPSAPAQDEKEKGVWVFTDAKLLQAKRDYIVTALAKREGTPLIRKSRALYWSSKQDIRGAFTVSKRYTKKGGASYWYAYHPQWREFLEQAERGFIVLGCMDRDEGFAIPVNDFHPLLSSLHTTEKEDGSFYWHLHLHEDDSGKVFLNLPKRREPFFLVPFSLSI